MIFLILLCLYTPNKNITIIGTVNESFVNYNVYQYSFMGIDAIVGKGVTDEKGYFLINFDAIKKEQYYVLFKKQGFHNYSYMVTKKSKQKVNIQLIKSK